VVPEVLLVPLYLSDNSPMGTLWIVAEEEGHFHADHARTATELASFVGIALKMLRTEHRLQQSLQEQEMLTREMSHRVKNLFAVSDAMVRLSAASASSKEEMARVLTGRFHALASAHGLIRRSFSSEEVLTTVANVAELLHAVLKPHDGQPSRFSVVGPPLACGEHALNGIALIFHELATNALKYGGFANEHGFVDIKWTTDSQVVQFVWHEQGGPAVSVPPQLSGFGSRLLRDTVEGQFRGSLSHAWNPDGLIVQIAIPLERLTY
jgi:two-component sensor histidine kinase